VTSKSYPARNKSNPPSRNEVSAVKQSHTLAAAEWGRKCIPLDNKDFEDVVDADTGDETVVFVYCTALQLKTVIFCPELLRMRAAICHHNARLLDLRET